MNQGLRNTTCAFQPISEKLRNEILTKSNLLSTLDPKQKQLIESEKEPSENELAGLLASTKNAENWLEICFLLEKTKKKAHETAWISGLEKYQHSQVYIENLGYFFYQKNRFHKALEYLTRLLQQSNSFFARILAIGSAYAVGQYSMVLDLYNQLDKTDKIKLHEDLIVKIATASLEEKQYELATNLFEQVRTRNKLPSLPGLKEQMKKKFNGEKGLEKWFMEISPKTGSKETRKTLTLEECITYSSALMLQGKHKEAETFLIELKKERFNK